uniref:Centrosomal protein of 19 kDa n=1 Tax=Canis lupus familiaris TaxID=9615 RepID=A0A8I3S7G7_CANLF
APPTRTLQPRARPPPRTLHQPPPRPLPYRLRRGRPVCRRAPPPRRGAARPPPGRPRPWQPGRRRTRSPTEHAGTKCGRRSLRAPPAAPRARRRVASDRDGRRRRAPTALASAASRSPGTCGGPGLRGAGSPAALARRPAPRLPAGGGARAGARAVADACAVAVGTTGGAGTLTVTLGRGAGRDLRRRPASRPGSFPPPPPGTWGSALRRGNSLYSHVAGTTAAASPCSASLRRPQSRSPCCSVRCARVGAAPSRRPKSLPCRRCTFRIFSEGQVYVRMMCTAKKCGIRFQPPAIILIYENEMKEKSRQRIMPVRNFSKFSDCSRAAEQLKNNPRHKNYLEQVPLRQLEKLFSFLRGYLWGQSLAETMEQFKRETTIDPEEDLNKLDDKELAKRKSIMDELFEKNQKKKDDPNFVYDIEVEFPQDEQLQSCGWDTESADEF